MPHRLLISRLTSQGQNSQLSSTDRKLGGIKQHSLKMLLARSGSLSLSFRAFPHRLANLGVAIFHISEAQTLQQSGIQREYISPEPPFPTPFLSVSVQMSGLYPYLPFHFLYQQCHFQHSTYLPDRYHTMPLLPLFAPASPVSLLLNLPLPEMTVTQLIKHCTAGHSLDF